MAAARVPRPARHRTSDDAGAVDAEGRPHTLRTRAQARYPAPIGTCSHSRSAERTLVGDSFAATPDPRGDRRPPAALLPGPARDRRAPGRDDLVGAARRAGRRERGQGAQGPLVPRLLRHPRRRLRRRVPAPRDLARARPHPRLAGRHRRDRQPGSRARQLPWLRRPRLSRRGAGRRRPRPRRASRWATSTVEPIDDLDRIVAERKIAIGILATPGGRRPGRRRPAGRGGRARRSSTSRRRCCTVPDGVSMRKVDLAIELQILSFYQLRRGTDRRRERAG